jgi:hypothetical protein
MNRALIALTLLSLSLVMQSGTSVSAHNPANDGLVAIDTGSAAFYSPSWDGAGWDRIRLTQARNHGIDASKVYDPDGWYCVRPGYGIGDVLTIRNENTGATGTCVVADMVAPGDQAYWWSNFVIELSYRAFAGLGLDSGNNVSVWVLP